jgi:2-polyprenyl-3-methyl-5-hydroxy-6-metoxy-1,4-benzoquinol methylase
MPIELMNQDIRVTPDVEPLQIDAEALVRDFSKPALPHDPAIDEIVEPVLLPVPPCAVCEATQAEARYSIRGTQFRLVVCTECGLGTLNPRPTPGQIASFYPPEYYGSPGAKFTPLIERFVRRLAARRGRQLTNDLPAGSRVLDVGCGRGVLLSTMADQGMVPHGFEISPTAALGADPRADIAIANSLEQAAYPDGYFDLVVLCHVLEHLPDPKNTLLEIRRILKPGGKLVVSVPNFSSWQAERFGPAWFHLDLPRHLFHFPANGLRQLLANTGFRSTAEQHFSLSQNPFGWVQSLLNQSETGPRNSLYSQLKMSSAPSDSCPSFWKSLGNRTAYWLGMPLGVAFSLLSAAFRRGATVTIIAENPFSAD